MTTLALAGYVCGVLRRLTMSLSLCCLAAALWGCPKDDEPTTFTLVKLSGAESCDNKPLVAADLERSTYTLRLTFLKRDESDRPGPVSLRRHVLECFRIFEPQDTVDFVVPSADQRHTLRVEAFGANGELAFSGMAHNQDLAAGENVTIYLHPTGAKNKSCRYDARYARAFHSSTVLPNGEVLFMGGLTTKDGSVQLQEQALGNPRVVRFDPTTLTWLEVGSLPRLARAFHQAVLLPSPPEGPYDILVIGGLMAAEGASEALVARVRLQSSFDCTPGPCSHFFNFIPHENGRPGETGIVTYTPPKNGKGGSVTYQPWAGANIDGGYYPQLTLLDDTHALLVGGAGAYRLEPTQAMGDPGAATWITLQSVAQGGPTATTSTVSILRAGHAVARTSQGFLIVGGKMDGTYLELAADFAESSATSGGGFLPLAAPPLPIPAPDDRIESTGWHTLTPLGLTDQQLFAGTAANEVLYAGGFTGRSNATGNRPYRPSLNGFHNPNPYYRLALSGAASSVEKLGDGGTAGSYPDVGYHRALRLADGSVLLSGGNSNKCRQPCAIDEDCVGSKCTAEKRCESEGDSNFCASDAVIVLGPNSDTPKWDRSAIAQLAQPRYGHVSVRLLDDSVLIVGGLQARKNTPTLLSGGERYQLADGKIIDQRFWMVQHDGTPLADKQLSSNQNPGTCLTRADVGKVLASLTPHRKTVTAPLPRTSKGRRNRKVRFVWAPAAP